MNIQNIKTIIDSKELEETKKTLILQEISKDKRAIPYLITILGIEREINKELISDSNLELSRALVTLRDLQGRKTKAVTNLRDFTIDKIKEHYLKWKDTIRCNFNIKGLP